MTVRHALFGLLALISSAAALAEPETGSRIDRAPLAVTDSANDPVVSKVVNRFARCVADDKPDWADRVLMMELLSAEQIKLANKEANGFHTCFTTFQFDLKLSTLSLLGGVAEQRIEQRFGGLDVSRLSAITDDQLFASAAAPKTTTEDFATCLVRKDPRTSRRLISSEPNSPAEAKLVGALIPHLGACLPAGLNLTLNKQTVRAYSAIGLYHLLARGAVPASTSTGRS